MQDALNHSDLGFRLRSEVEQADQVKREGHGERDWAKEPAGAKAARQEEPGLFHLRLTQRK